MATVMLRGARSYHYAGLVFRTGDPTAVDDKTARDLANYPEYFDVVLDDAEPKAARKPSGSVKVTHAAPAVGEPPAVEI